MIIFVIFILFVIISLLITVTLNQSRIERYLEEQNCQLISKNWEPFGSGWAGEKDSMIYEITYKDQQGRIHQAYCKTSLMSGVYLSKDKIIEDNITPVESELEKLKKENQRLQDELNKFRD